MRRTLNFARDLIGFIKVSGLALTLFSILPLASSVVASTVESTVAVRLGNGKTYFNQIPRLVDAYTTQNSVNVSNALYYFNIQVPKDAEEPLKKIEIKQFRALEDIELDPTETQTGTAIAIDKDKNISVVFNPPIAPGENINIKLRSVRNPRIGGVYLFGVTAFPQGEDPYGQFLGYGRLHFYDSFDNN